MTSRKAAALRRTRLREGIKRVKADTEEEGPKLPKCYWGGIPFHRSFTTHGRC